MRSVGILLAGALIGALLGFAAFQFDLVGAASPESSPVLPASTVTRTSFTALGAIEPKHGVINVSSPLLGQRISSVINKDPEAGDVVVELDSESIQTELRIAKAQLEAAESQQDLAIDLAKAELEAAQDSLAQIKTRLPIETKSTQMQLDALQDKVDQAIKDGGRLRNLKEKDETLVSKQRIELADLAKKGAEAELEAAKTARLRMEQGFDTSKKLAEAQLRTATKRLEAAIAGKSVESLRDQVALIQLKLDQTKVHSPISGAIIKRFARVGELVTQQPLVQVADLTSLACMVEVDAADIQHVKAGQEVKIAGRALGDLELDGKVVSIGNTVRSATMQAFSPLAAVDRDVVEVTVEIAEMEKLWPDKRRALLGLQVEVKFPIR